MRRESPPALAGAPDDLGSTFMPPEQESFFQRMARETATPQAYASQSVLPTTDAPPAERAELAEVLVKVAMAAGGFAFSFSQNTDGRMFFSFVSAHAKATLGVDVVALRSDAQLFFGRVNFDDRVALRESLAYSAENFTVWRKALRYTHPEKGEIWLEAIGAPERQKNHSVVWNGCACEVSDRAVSEQARLTHVARLQSIIDGSRDGIFSLDESNHILSVNMAGLNIFEYRESEIVGRDFFELFLSADGDADTPRLKGGAREGADLLHARRASGAIFPVELLVKQVAYDHASISVAFVSDLSERIKKQKLIEKLTLERLSAIAGMAEMLAHQINQPLTAASTYLKVCQRLLPRRTEDSFSAISDTIEKASAQMVRAGHIVRSLRELVAHGEPDKTLVSLNALIAEALELAAPQLEDARVTITKRLFAEPDLVVADSVQIKQVLLNLIRNAIEAMQESSLRDLCISSLIPNATSIRVEVRDTGTGLSEFIEKDLFEPFASSKAKGMGISLSISREIIESHYGRLWATPNPDGGATFGFDLPPSERESD